MKKTLQSALIGFCLSQTISLNAQLTLTGPSSSQSPYVKPSVPGATITSILTATNIIGTYTMCGIPDGLGAYDNGGGTFTVLMNHELGNTVGAIRAHGSIGAFVSKWIINKSNLSVVSGSDLMQNVNLWNGTSYTLYNSSNTSTLAAFNRFCSADLPPVSAFYNTVTGKGTQERIFMNGEESGDEGRAVAHIATGPNAGTSWELPYLGKYSKENQVACPFMSDTTIVGGMDDQTPGQVYFYIGTKTNSGNEIQKAGLSGGKLFGVKVNGMSAETSTSIPTAGTSFSLVNLGIVQSINGATLNANSNAAGVTTFLRPEDGAWDPSNPNDFYFNTTNAFTSPSRLWKLSFTNIANPQLGGTITAVLDGTEGQKMLDNLCVANGYALLQEDVGNQIHNGRMFKYNIATDVLTPIAYHDSVRFVTAGPSFLTQDEETSGIIDVSSILGPGKFLFVDQAHYAIGGGVVEGGQLMLLDYPTLVSGIKQSDEKESIVRLFPNPTNDESTLKIVLEKNEHVIVKLVDILGKTVSSIIEKDLERGDQSIKLNTSELKNGLYFVNVIVGENANNIKLVIEH